MSPHLSPLQVGVGVSGGAEAVLRAVQSESEGLLLALMVFRNALNSVSRLRMLQEV